MTIQGKNKAKIFELSNNKTKIINLNKYKIKIIKRDKYEIKIRIRGKYKTKVIISVNKIIKVDIFKSYTKIFYFLSQIEYFCLSLCTQEP